MKIVDKHSLEIIRGISNEEKQALAELYAKTGETNLVKANLLIESTRAANQYFKCDCVIDQPASPMLTSRKLSDDTYALVNLPGRHAHSKDCPFRYSSHDSADTHSSHALGKLVDTVNGRITVNEEQLKVLYRTLVTNTQLNRISYDENISFETIRSRMIDGARLDPNMAKQQLSKRVYFGIEQYSSIVKKLKDSPEDDWAVLISMVTGYDGINLYKGDDYKAAYKIPAGSLVSKPDCMLGPIAAVTIVASKSTSVFSLATSLDSVYSTGLPIVVSCQEDKTLIDSFTGEKSLLAWIDSKQTGTDSKSYIDVHCLPITTPISDSKIEPRFTITKQGLKLVIGAPLREEKVYYDEIGNLLWHRQFSHIGKRASEELNSLKSKIAAILLKKS